MKIRQIAKKYREIEHIKIYLLLGLIFLSLLFYLTTKIYDRINHTFPVAIGVSFSPSYASALGLNPQQTYRQMFKDLKISRIRLPAYWDEIETKQNQFDFTNLDFYVNTATQNNSKIILAIGYKLPRWPECRIPKWMESSATNIKYRQERQLLMLARVVEHYENNPLITAWQVENEPLLSFGTCDPPDESFLRKEVAFVRSISHKPVILTDSGELSSWITPMQLSDYFGTTMYRTVYNPIVGTIPYPLQPWYYRLKSDAVRILLAPQNKATINVELQAEPWAQIFIADIPISTQLEHFTLQDFKDNVNFAKKVGTPEIYLWGVEWWYWVRTQGHPEFLDYAKTILK